MEVLIVSKTQMKSAVCVGGLLLDYDANIRLLNPGNRNQPIDTDFEIGQIWDLRFIKRNPLHLPHTEDRIVLEKNHLRKLDNIYSFLIERNINIHEGSAKELFESKLEWTQYGSGFIREENKLPDYSVGFWKSDRDLELYQSFNKPRYRYNSNINLPFVGLQEPVNILPKGTLLRYSLTRAFDKDKNGKKSSWLQLSGWYENKETKIDFDLIDDDLPF